MTQLGIDEEILQSLVAVFSASPAVDQVVIYGSRARGTFKNYSDIDIALYAPTLPWNDFLDLRSRIDDLPCIFAIDLIHIDTLSNLELRAKIKRDGVLIYQRSLQ